MSTPIQGSDNRMPYPHHDPYVSYHVDAPAEPGTDPDAQAPSDLPGHGGHGRHGRHGLMMLVCCIPMIIIAVLVVATGAAGSGALLWALGCVAMMAMMMFMMPGGHQHK